jgi:ATP-dependent Lon protease
MMLRTVLDTDRRFGVVRWDPQEGRMADVGCCAEILQCQTQSDDRSNIVTLGQQRFRVLEVVREAPFKVGLVSWIEDEHPENHDRLSDLSSNVEQALKDVVELTGKLMGKPTSLPTDLPDLPRELSFWIGSHLGWPISSRPCWKSPTPKSACSRSLNCWMKPAANWRPAPCCKTPSGTCRNPATPRIAEP